MRKRNQDCITANGLKTYTKKEMYMYLIGLAGQNVIYNIIGTGLQFYFESVIFMPALAIGVIMAAARVWDAFNDPMMGTFADKTRTKWGKFRPYLMFVPIPILLITVLCFTSPGGIYTDPAANKALIVAWAGITYILWGMTYTVGDIPLWGITAVMTEDDGDRNKLLSLARVFAAIGGAISLVAIIPFSKGIGTKLETTVFADLGADAVFQGNRYGFLIGALIFGLIGSLLFQLVGIFTRERIKPSEKRNSIRQNFKLMWANKPFRQLLVSGILSSPKQVIMIVAFTLIDYYYCNGDETQTIMWYIKLGLGLFAGQFGAILIMPMLVKKYEKKTLYNFSNLICAIPLVLIYVSYLVAPNHDVTTPFFIILFAILFAFGGFSIGATMVLQSLMIADCVDYEEHQSGLRPDGVFFSGQSFITKLSSGIATIMCSAAYFAVGFEKEKRQAVVAYMEDVANTVPARLNPEFETFMAVMFFLIAVPPAIGCILSVIPTWKYALPNKVHKQILAELNEKRHLEDNETVVSE